MQHAMKNPKPSRGRGSSHKTSSATVQGGTDGRKFHLESSKNTPSERNAPTDSTPSKEDIPGPSSGPTKPPTHAAATFPTAFHHLNAASSPPPPPYGFHNLERRTIVLADGTVRSYFALPPDYQMDPRGEKYFHPAYSQGFDPRLPSSEGFREPQPPFARGGADYWSSLGLDGPAGPAGSSSLKRKYGQEEFAWHRQQVQQHGSSAMNPMGFSTGSIADGLGRSGSPSRKEPKQVKLGAEGYDDSAARRLRAEGKESLVARDVDQKALKDAFLRLSKSINENLTNRKNYLEDGKSGPLQCIV